MKAARFCTLLVFAIVGWTLHRLHAQSADELGSKVPELLVRLKDFDADRSEALEPLKGRQQELREKYASALAGLMEQVTKSGNLDAALAVKNEMETVTRAEDVLRSPPEPVGGSELAKYRKIFEDEWKKIEAEQAVVVGRVRQKLIDDLKSMEVEMTQVARLDDAIAVRAVRSKMEAALGASTAVAPLVDPRTTVSEAMLQRMREEGGRLRLSGNIMPSLSATVPEVESLPTDFVKVHAFRTAWIAIRKNGSCIVMGLDRNRQEHRIERGWRVELVARSYDAWCYERRKLVHRLVNWEIDRPSSLASPIAIASNHAACVLFNSRGDTEHHGPDRLKDVQTPARVLLSSVKDVVSSKHTFLVIDEGGRGRLWDAELGRPVPNPILEASILRDAEGGEQHYTIVDQHGVVSVLPGLHPSPEVASVPVDLGDVLRVKAGGNQSAVQRSDGTWKSWGASPFVTAEVDRIGVSPDLDIYYGEGAEYAIWIEPVR